MRARKRSLAVAWLVVLLGFPLVAQSISPPVSDTTTSDRREMSNNQQDWHYIGHVEMNRDPRGTSRIFADDVWIDTAQGNAIATGNVLLAEGPNRISAERAEFTTRDSLGTFYNAWGMATVTPSRHGAIAGGVAPPPMTRQETVIIFFGEKVEKLGLKKYRITNGGFSTCAQPTPRWDLHAGTVILNVDHYTILTNAVMNVKGVPLFYLPVFYYPTTREDRATGLLIPTYGASTLRGQSIHNAFFWAINRSQDATFMHDWFSKTGQGYTGEYRYNYGAGANGMFRANLLDTHETTYGQSDREVPTLPAGRDFEIRGNAQQLVAGNLRARANANYFSSIQTSQNSNTNINDGSRSIRSFGGNVIGAWETYTFNATVDRSESFAAPATKSSVFGNAPRIDFVRNERPLGRTPTYFSLRTEFAHLLRVSNSTDTDAATGDSVQTTDDGSVSRIDIAPQIRYPFKRWAWFTVNNTVTAHETYYSRTFELDANGRATSTVVDVPLNRPVVTYEAQIVGPVFNRVWNTPGNYYAEKFKHTIEPVLTIDRTATIGDVQRVINVDSVDSYVSGVRYKYGLNNRFYAKRSVAPGRPAAAREIVDVTISQTYYTQEQASVYDHQYQTSALGGEVPSNYSPIALRIAAMPIAMIDATVNAEFDSRYRQLRTISTQAAVTTGTVRAALGWSRKAFIAELDDFNNPAKLDHTINGSTNLHTRDDKFGAQYSGTYDVLRGGVTQQRITGFYNAQCCGLAMEYQTYNFGPQSSSPIPADHRFFVSFTLAGLGNFSPFSGALSGVPH